MGGELQLREKGLLRSGTRGSNNNENERLTASLGKMRNNQKCPYVSVYSRTPKTLRWNCTNQRTSGILSWSVDLTVGNSGCPNPSLTREAAMGIEVGSKVVLIESGKRPQSFLISKPISANRIKAHRRRFRRCSKSVDLLITPTKRCFRLISEKSDKRIFRLSTERIRCVPYSSQTDASSDLL